MTEDNFFEIRDLGNYVRIEPTRRIKYNSDISWDHNWIKVNIAIKGGAFSGSYQGELLTVDLLRLKNDFSQLYNNLNGILSFNDIEGYLEMKITGDGIGHFSVNVRVCDKPGYGSELSFMMSFDQTQIKEMVNQLGLIAQDYPQIGNS
jgi:hypothetical protein